ncbi:sulfite exporter TauE/SafE family protein [Stakelama sp. CBK3Z-3]|uniref:Probable membrane transporter protein n=1 Tax=Stakelama flava TaxID=2860338 RepID=A0ABS6XNG4_9SPHN|nr:sulfite exporter TauE/SafE family protein [Stakelama flava]MBW4331721.1 sulfite exporter TauE/SafE family protein [Stakelama flava]
MKIAGAIGAILLALGYAAIWVFAPLDHALLARLWFLPGIGVLGATIANTSGTGGGVVFVPVFNALRDTGVMALDRTQVVAASFLIQCFGMSMGAIRWSAGLHRQPVATRDVSLADFWRVVGVVLAGSLPVMLVTQRVAAFDPHDVLLAFKAFSLSLGAGVVATTWTVNRTRPALRTVTRGDFFMLAAIGLVGGFVTALFSVGVGELVALYLFIRHYPVVLCAGAAVVISSLSCLAGAPFHIANGTVMWEVVALAAPGALIGGYLARPLALWLGAARLKTIDGCWIVASSLYLIALNV